MLSWKFLKSPAITKSRGVAYIQTVNDVLNTWQLDNREFKLQVQLLPVLHFEVMWVFTPHGSVVINAACETNDFNFEVAV